MNIDKHYPFSLIKLDYNLSGFSNFLDFQTMSIHYNQIYKEYVDNLNELIKDEPVLQNLTIEEILFNKEIIPLDKRNDVLKNAGGVYNHEIIFQSITPNPLVIISPQLRYAIEKKFQTTKNFFDEFVKLCLKTTCGYVFLVCDQNGDVSLKSIQGTNTTVPDNLCPLFGIDLFEHAYYLNYFHNVKDYVDNFLKYINFDFVNTRFFECISSIIDFTKKK